MLYLARDYFKIKSDKIQTFIHLYWNEITTISSCLKHSGNWVCFFFPSSADQHCSVHEQDIHLAGTSCSSCCCDKSSLLQLSWSAAEVCSEQNLNCFLRRALNQNQSKGCKVVSTQRQRNKKISGWFLFSWIYRLSGVSFCIVSFAKTCNVSSCGGGFGFWNKTPHPLAMNEMHCLRAGLCVFMCFYVFNEHCSVSSTTGCFRLRSNFRCFGRGGESNAATMMMTVLWNMKGNHMLTLNSPIFPSFCLGKVERPYLS